MTATVMELATLELMDMSKYRGEIDGRERGEYRLQQLRAEFSPDEILDAWGSDVALSSPAADVDAYLSRIGVRLNKERRYLDELLFRFLGTYHCGGATILVQYLFHSDLPDDVCAGKLSLELVTNEPADDVADRLRRRFPYLRTGRHNGVEADF